MTTAAVKPVRAGIALAILGTGMWFGGCSDSASGPCSDCPPVGQLMVSNPVSALSLASATGAASTGINSAADEVAYVSLPPGTSPTGRTAVIQRVGDAGSIVTTVSDGGFDPMPVNAAAGDSIDVIVRDAANGTVLQARLAVAARRPPVVVRTNPPRKRKDVPLNAAIVIVFSEPVADNSLTAASIQLFRGTSAVPGTIQILQGTGAAAAFVPAAPLATNTTYRLEIRRGIQDLEGDALAAAVTVEFTTGQSSTGPAASIVVSPDSVFLRGTGPTYQLTATVRDAAGNELIDQPVTWSTSDSAGLTVSPTGLLTALAVGGYFVGARVDSLQAFAVVLVSPGPPASVAVSPTPATIGAAGDTIIMTATVRDSAGNVIYRPPVTWTSSAPEVATVAPSGYGTDGLALGTVTSVSPGTVTITATSEPASGTASVTVTPGPTAPSETDAKPENSNTVQVRWIDNSTNETGFRVQRSTDLGTTWTTYSTTSAKRTFVSDVGPFAIEQQVCYRVIAFNAQGESPPSPPACTTPPAGPVDLTVAAVDQQTNDLAWTDNSAVEDGYEVQRSDGTTAYSVVAQLAANSTSYRDVGVSGGAAYRVRATKDGGGSDYSNVANTIAPNVPSGVGAMPAWSSTAAGITWTDNSTNEEGFRVERSTDGGGSWAAAGTTGANPPYLSHPIKFVDGAASEQEVCYRVIAFNSAGESPPSNTACTAPPAGATNLTATWVVGGILLAWTDNSAVEDGYTLLFTTDCAEEPEIWLGGIPANATSHLLTEFFSCLGGVPEAFVVVVTKDGGYGDSSNVASPPPREP